ncbi:MAG TPA: bifunctional serine/threonine-protein kinase/formylglycine-generating enzyme family protein [Thermoguttaceae bacterium]|nr:bifunctional serine/threonine-protein kinase/formylglycine-generating enzyme family protein [Thermoguttaceae bacterium]
MPVSLTKFAENLVRSGLFSAAELSDYQKSVPPERRPKNAQGLARELIQAGRLTKYQAAAVYQGKTKSLVFGEYTVLELIGQGGMGQVFKARHRTMQRIVALKVLPRRGMQSPSAVKRFEREVRAAARLMHPNIVTAYDAGEQEGIHYLVMEYVNGMDLAAILAEQGPLAVAQAIDYTAQAAKGLAYAHSEGIVHRDIKPGNLLVDEKGTVKILDMGLARMASAGGRVGSEESESLTTSGQVMGTCDYMAPEQAEDTHRADHRADVYSLGCTLYRLLTARKPYEGDTMIKILLSHREAPIPSLSAARPDVPASLDAVCQKMMAKTPEERYQSMSEVIDALSACVTTREPVPPPVVVGASRDSALTSFLQQLSEDPAVGRPKPTRYGEETFRSQVGQETSRAIWRRLVPLERPNMMLYGGIAAGVVALVVVLGLLFASLGGGKRNGDETAARGGDGPSALAPLEAEDASEHQKAWAEQLDLPAQMTNSIGMKLVLIPPGEFDMGSSRAEIDQLLEEARDRSLSRGYISRLSNEGPQHRVKVTSPYYLGACEVTQAEYQRVVGVNSSHFSAQGVGKGEVAGRDTSRYPAECISWEAAQGFCRELSDLPEEQSAGRVYRLPTEAEWEYACRAGTTTRYAFGDDAANLGDYAWVCENAGGITHPVGQKKPNRWGLFDVHGNVLEWCEDWFDKDYYERSPSEDPAGRAGNEFRVLRGGSWVSPDVDSTRSACRDYFAPHFRARYIGFRVVCVIEAGAEDGGGQRAASRP